MANKSNPKNTDSYVALLRGINVGGNNIIAMPELKLCFERTGMQNVLTYINTGNIVFTASGVEPSNLVIDLQNAIHNDFGLEIKVLLRSYEAMKAVVNFVPNDWANNSRTKCDVLFLWEDIDNPAIVNDLNRLHSRNDFLPRVGAEISAPNDDPEQLFYVAGAVVWYVDRSRIDKCHALQKLASNKLYKRMTVRNINTTRKIYALMRDQYCKANAVG